MGSEDYARHDFYAVLGVAEDATPEEIRKAARRLKREFHPDRFSDSDLTDGAAKVLREQYDLVDRAEDVLLNDRPRYDSVRAGRAAGAESSPPPPPPPRSPHTYEQYVELTPEEWARGKIVAGPHGEFLDVPPQGEYDGPRRLEFEAFPPDAHPNVRDVLWLTIDRVAPPVADSPRRGGRRVLAGAGMAVALLVVFGVAAMDLGRGNHQAAAGPTADPSTQTSQPSSEPDYPHGIPITATGNIRMPWSAAGRPGTVLLVHRARGSCQAPPSIDAAGHRVTYQPRRAIDGRLSTAWRCRGKGGGRLTFAPRRAGGEAPMVDVVGLVPGYAKVDPVDGTDRFAQNHTVTRVRWALFDGSKWVVVEQSISRPEPHFAWIHLADPVRVHKVSVIIQRTGNRAATRNYAPISEVAIGRS